MNVHLVVLLAYSAVLMVLGLWIGRRVKKSGDFFVAGRALGPPLVLATVLAANIGAGSTVGAAGLGYADGLSAWWWVGSAGIGTLILAFWVGPKVRRVAAGHGFYTVGDFLEHRYGATVRGVIASLLWLGSPAILGAQLLALAVVLQAVAGVPVAAGCLLGGVVMITYFTAGGLVGAAWINLVQLVVLLGGFAIAVPMALADAGGWSAVTSAAPEISGDFMNFWRGGGSGWVLLPLLAPNFIVSPGLLQKVYGARNDRAVRIGVGLSGIVLLVFALAPALLGMIARVGHPDLALQDLALPTVLLENVPVIVGAIGLGALFVADVSSADAILFMLSTSLSQDLYKRFVKPDADDARLLSVARWAAFGGGSIGVVMAIAAPSVVALMKVFYTLVAVTLFIPVIAALYTRKAGPPEALASIAAGIAVTVTARLATGGSGFGHLTPELSGLIVAGLGFISVMAVRRRRAASQTGSQAER